MNRRTVFSVVVIVAVAVGGYSVWSYVNHLDYLSKAVHETDRWAVVVDSKGDIMAVETTSDEVWDQLLELHEKDEERWIGGIVEEYGNKWGFRFRPDTIITATITIEGAQSNTQGISSDLEYWIEIWANVAYVWAGVVEIHE